MGGNGIGAGYARLIDAANKYSVKLVPQRLRTEPRPGELMFHLYGQGIKLDDWAARLRFSSREMLDGARSKAAAICRIERPWA